MDVQQVLDINTGDLTSISWRSELGLLGLGE